MTCLTAFSSVSSCIWWDCYLYKIWQLVLQVGLQTQLKKMWRFGAHYHLYLVVVGTIYTFRIYYCWSNVMIVKKWRVVYLLLHTYWLIPKFDLEKTNSIKIVLSSCNYQIISLHEVLNKYRQHLAQIYGSKTNNCNNDCTSTSPDNHDNVIKYTNSLLAQSTIQTEF